MIDQAALPFADDANAGFADVAVDAPGKDAYTYAVPSAMAEVLAPGDGVLVPYGRQRLRGFVIRRHQHQPDFACKAILERRDDCRLPEQLLELVRWGAGYYRCHLGEFLAAAVPAPVREGVRFRGTRFVAPVAGFDGKLTPRQREVLALLPEDAVEFPAALRLAECSASVLEKLVEKGALTLTEDRTVVEHHVGVRDERHALTDEQQIAVDTVAAALEAQEHRVICCYGVTGSGKTLVYLDLAERVVARGEQVLVLLPEIGLTPQLAARFRRRFDRVAVWHSGFSAGERAEQWGRVARGEVDLVIGTRSALFAPLERIGLIIVDEEHDGSFKQDSDPRYQGRDLAVVYARQLGVPIILGTATPSLETYHNVLQGRYEVVTLRQRPGGGALPAPQLVDMAQESQRQKRRAVVSDALVERLQAGKERGEQAIVLLNRRGWSPVVECVGCGHTMGCPHCDIGLTFHRGDDLLRCHYCGYQIPWPRLCPACKQPELSTKGLGTEQLEARLQAAVPGLSTIRVDADTVAKKHGHARLLQRFSQGEADCLVGTQMVAKGLDFPNVTTVGIVQADRGLGIPDFRAAERTFQLVAQVAGRAGRGAQPGAVIVQAFDIEAPALVCALSLKVKQFYRRELELRQQYRYPPHAGLVRFLWTGPSIPVVQARAQSVCDAALPLLEGCTLLGPTAAGIAVIKDQVRWHALVKGASRGAIQAFLDRLDASGTKLADAKVRCAVDVDPLTIS